MSRKVPRESRGRTFGELYLFSCDTFRIAETKVVSNFTAVGMAGLRLPSLFSKLSIRLVILALDSIACGRLAGLFGSLYGGGGPHNGTGASRTL